MPRTFDTSADYHGSVEAVLDAFADRGYWLARLADSGTDEARLDDLDIAPDGAITVATTQVLHQDNLPPMVRQFHRGNLDIERRERWAPIIEGASAATVSGAIPGAPVLLSGSARLSPSGAGSRLQLQAGVTVRVPLVGSSIESLIGAQLLELITVEQRFTDEWISGRR